MHIPSYTNGFTIIEVLVVLALAVGIGGLALMVSFDTYRASSLRVDQGALISVLQHARALSLHAVCLGSTCTEGASHGVAIQSDTYVIFEGPSYALRNVENDVDVEARAHIVHSGLSEIVFASSSARVVMGGDIILTDEIGHSSTISIGSEGQIVWNH